MNKTQRGFWSAFTLGGVASIGVLFHFTGLPPFDALIWFLILPLGGLAGLYWGTVYLAVVHAFTTPRALLRTALLLALPSLLIWGNWAREGRNAAAWIADADSTKGRIAKVSTRGGNFVFVDYVADRASRSMVGPMADNAVRPSIGDSIWVYFPRQTPDSGIAARPRADTNGAYRLLAWTWLLGGPLVLAYAERLRRPVG